MKRDQQISEAPPCSVDEIFAEAAEMEDRAARRAFVEKASAGNPALLAELQELLVAHDTAREFLNDASGTLTEAASKPVARAMAGTPEIPGFRIGRLLGRGGLGAVYEAYDQKLERTVAIKVLSSGDDAQLRALILGEARRAAALKDPAIVTVYSVHDEGAWPAISMELVEGFPVDRATVSLSFEQKARILQQIARAIAVAHKAGVIHRDLKPENVIVTPDLQPKVLDFGLAVSLEEAGARRNFFEGTPRYASPEQVGGKPITPASDVFSFGSLMFKILTGRPAFDGRNAVEVLEAICTSQPPFLRDVAVGVPEDLQAICLACLAWKPEDRPSASDVATDIARYLAGEPVRLRPALYGDILRQKISEYSSALLHWERQGMISSDEKDRLDVVHRRILADEEEDQWIIDARRISIAQTILYTATWTTVVAAFLIVWLGKSQFTAPWVWLAPSLGTLWLLAAGWSSARRKEPLASASFLAGAALAIAPTSLAILQELKILAIPPENERQLFSEYTNAQLFAVCLTAVVISAAAWRRLKMTGFAWTTATLGSLTYWTALLCGGWLDKRPEIMALWMLPLVAFQWISLECERRGKVRWGTPFRWIAMITLVICLDVIARNGPTLRMIGLDEKAVPFLTPDRQQYLSFALNGYLFLALMMITERAKSLDLRRASKVLEGLAMLHLFAPLFLSAQAQRENPSVGYDAALYIGTVVLLLALAPWRASWRILVGALGGVAAASYLLIDLNLVSKSTFTIALGSIGIAASAAMYYWLLKTGRRPKARLTKT